MIASRRSHMKHTIVGVSVAVLSSIALVTAAPQQSHEKGKNQPLTIRGCVRPGDEPDTFLLMRVTEVRPGNTRGTPVATDMEGRDVLSWLTSPRGLDARPGHRVEVKGTIDPADPQHGTTKVSED